MAEIELYGKRTSAKAEKLIIDFFNKINNGKPYKMKTITTIYKNDDIFKENQRYPIDAPYRDFYIELTEKYVVDHNLDSIFFENGIAKVGDYFFEFGYSQKSNLFSIFNYPRELGIETSKSYVPMLFSMVTGEKIDWEAAREKVQFKSSIEDSTSVLLVFGNDNLDTLEFSWVATFEINNKARTEIKSISKEIREQETEILNFTQGVLFSELNDVILEFDRIRELVKNHKHTIKNFGFEGHLMKLHSKIEAKDFDGAMKIFDYIENLAMLRDITTNILYNFDGKSSDLLLTQKANTYSKILSLLFSTSTRQETNSLIIDDSIETNPINTIEETDLIDVFTVLLNLYSNIHSKSSFSIAIRNDNPDNIQVIFLNDGVIEEKYRQYLLGIINVNPSKGEGLRFVVNSLRNLPHIKMGCSVEKNETKITLTINKKQ